MERQRRVSYAGLGAVALVMALAAPALAASGSAHLVAAGPVVLDGRSSVVAEGGDLLLRDPGSEAFEAVALSIPAEAATVTKHEISMSCVAPGAWGRIGLVEGLPERLGLSRLADAVAAGQAALDPALGQLTATRTGLGLPAAPIVDGAAAALDARAPPPTEPRAGPLPPLPGPLGGVSCLGQGPRDNPQALDFRELTLTATATNGDYAALWRAAGPDEGHDERGSALVQGPGFEMRYLRDDENVRFVGTSDPWRDYDPVAMETLPGDSVRAEAPAADGALLGAGTLWLYNVQARVFGLAEGDQPGQFRTETYETGQQGDGDNRVLTILEVAFRGASGSFSSPGQVLIQAGQLSANLDGTLRLRDATGQARLGDKTFDFDHQPAALLGQLAFAAEPADAQNRGLVLKAQGEVSSIEGAGAYQEQQQSQVTTAAAALSLAAIGAGLAAWFWPALKWLVAPMYTRIPKDTLLVHDARERIYKLIREEPGIHAHEVAARLDLGWGTAVYHLKLLERNGLVVARHEGRYKRFFVTGDQRLQVKDAVALLRNPTSRRIATQVATQPGLIQKQVCEALGLSPSLASWHLQRLEQAQVVHAERLGRAVRYIPGQAWVELQHLDAAIRGPPAVALPEPAPPAAPGAA